MKVQGVILFTRGNTNLYKDVLDYLPLIIPPSFLLLWTLLVCVGGEGAKFKMLGTLAMCGT
jgi:hypothetical protein